MINSWQILFKYLLLQPHNCSERVKGHSICTAWFEKLTSLSVAFCTKGWIKMLSIKEKGDSTVFFVQRLIHICFVVSTKCFSSWLPLSLLSQKLFFLVLLNIREQKHVVKVGAHVWESATGRLVHWRWKKREIRLLILEAHFYDSFWWQPVIEISFDLNDSRYLLLRRFHCRQGFKEAWKEFVILSTSNRQLWQVFGTV